MLQRLVKSFRKQETPDIEKDMERVRNEYLRELAKLRSKYAQKFIALASEYDACLSQTR